MADIRHLLDKIRKAIYGKEVRGSLADGLEAVNNEVEDATEVAVNVEQRQDAVEQQFNTLLGEWSDDKPIDNAETIAARTNIKESKTYENLGKRLDEEYGKVTAQLAENEKLIKTKASQASIEELENSKANKNDVDALFEQTKRLITDKDERTNKRIDNLVVNSGNANAEVSESKQDFTGATHELLNQRLNADMSLVFGINNRMIMPHYDNGRLIKLEEKQGNEVVRSIVPKYSFGKLIGFVEQIGANAVETSLNYTHGKLTSIEREVI